MLLYRILNTANKYLNESNDLSVKNHLRTFSLIQNILTLATNYLHFQTTLTLTGKEENAVKMLDACHLLPRDQIFLLLKPVSRFAPNRRYLFDGFGVLRLLSCTSKWQQQYRPVANYLTRVDV